MTTATIQYSLDLNQYNPLTIPAYEYDAICKKPENNCYEILPQDRPVKLYLDVDIKYAVDTEDEGKEYLSEMPRIRGVVKNILSGFFTDKYNDKHVSISTSHHPFYKPYNAGKKALDDKHICKMSFHFVLNNIVALVSHQKLLIHKLNAYALTFIDADDREEVFKGEVFDPAPYMKTQKIRSPYSNKPLEKRPLKIESGTFEQSCISAFIPLNAFVWTEEIPERIVNVGALRPIQDTEKDRAIFTEGLQLLTPYAQGGKYSDWIRIGWAIKNTFNDPALFHDFSKLGGREYDRYTVDAYWDEMEIRPDGVRMGSIIDYMRKTDRQKTDDILAMFRIPETEDHDTDEETNSETSVENLPVVKKQTLKPPSYYITIDDIDDPYRCAIVISKTLKNNLVLCREKWFMVNADNLWKTQNEATFYITTEIRKYIDEGNKQNALQISRAEGEAKDKLIEIGKRYLKSYKDISKPAYMSVITKNLKTLLCDTEFIDKIDKLTDCLAFKNGVYNMNTGKFRDGILQSDFITETIPHDYIPANPTKTQFVKDALLKIMNNNPEHLEYFLSIIGYTFIGRANLEKAFYFCVDKTLQSKGDNGKTFYFDILTELMPCYVYNTKGNFLEKENMKKHKQLALMKGKRLVWIDEFGTKNMDPIFVKELANGLSTENEVMFGTSEKITVQFKVYGLTNHTVKIGENEDAVFNRYVQVSYGSHFDKTGQLKEDIPSQLRFKADPTLRDTFLQHYRNEIFGLIIEYANKYFKHKLPQIPQQFANDARETKMSNDEFASWIEENCIVEEDARVALKAIIHTSSMNEKKVKEGMKRLGYVYNKDMSKLGKDNNGKSHKGGYEGIKLREQEEEIYDMEDV